MVAARGARRPRGGARLAARTSPAGRRSPRCAARPRISPRSPTAASRSCRRAPPSTPRRRSRTSSARSSSPAPPTPPPIDGAVRFLEGAGHARHARARRRRGARAAPRRHAGRGDRARRARRSSAGARRSRRCSRRSASRIAIEARLRLAATPLGHALLSLLRFAWVGGGRRELYAFLRSPYSGIARGERRLRRGPAARPRRATRPTASRRRPSGSARRRSLPLRELRAAESPLAGARALLAVDGRDPRTASTRRRRRARPGSTCAAYAAATRLLDELERLGGARRAARDRRRARRARPARGRRAPRRRAGPRRRRSTCCARARAASTWSFVLGLEEGSLPRRGRAARRSSTTTGAASSGGGSSGPTPVSRDRYLFYTACTRATRRLLPRARGGDRRRLAARGEPVLGRGARPSSTRTTCAARRDGARSRSSPGRSTRRRPSASGCARSRGSRADPERPTWRSRSPTRTAGHGGSARARSRLRAADGAPEPGRARAPRRPHDVRRHRARAVRRLLLGLALRAGDRARRRSTPRPTRCSAARSPTRRCYTFYTRLPKELGAERDRPRDARGRRCASSSACLDEALRGGVRLELGDVDAAELREGLRRDLERFVRDEARSALTLPPRRFEVGLRHRPLGARAAARPRARRRPLRQRQDRPDRRRPVQRARDRPGLQVGQGLVLGARRSTTSGGSRSRSTCSCCATSSGSSRSAASTARSRAPARRARHAARATRATTCRASSRRDYLDEEAFWGQVETARARRDGGCRADPRAATSRTTRAAASARRGATSGRCAGWRARDERAGSAAAVAAAARCSSPPAPAPARRPCSSSGSSAPSATTGSTSTRCSSSPTPARRRPSCAARIRAALLERGRPDLARELDGAWISTIHGFCARLLRAHPFAVGDRPALPRARRGARRGAPRRGVRRGRSTRSAPRAIPSGCGCSRPTARDGLRRMLTGVYETLRSAGRPLRARARRGAADPRRRARRAARGGAVPGRRPGGDRAAAGRGARRARPPVAARAPDRPAGAARARRRARRRFEDARKRVEQAALEIARDARPGAAAGAARPASPPRTRRRRSASRRSTSRTSSCSRATCCATTSAIREAEQLRFRSIMVDEFQDTNALQCELIDLLARPGPAEGASSSSATSSSRSTASGTPTSTCSASAASARRSGCR